MPSFQDRYDAVVGAAAQLLVGLDFDGTLSPIVSDPTTARIHPDAPSVLAELAGAVGTVAIITGRPARQVIELGSLEDLGREHELVVLGQYGNERWSSVERRIVSPEPPEGLSDLRAALPTLLEQAGVPDAFVEEKGLAVAVHTRRCAEPRAAFDALVPVLVEAAREHDLAVEPGRLVIELRAPGMDKGKALRALVAERGAGAVTFVGDDLGDLEAFQVVHELRDQGMPGLLVCSGSDEESALRDLADVVVDGPPGVLELLTRLAADAKAR